MVVDSSFVSGFGGCSPLYFRRKSGTTVVRHRWADGITTTNLEGRPTVTAQASVLAGSSLSGATAGPERNLDAVLCDRWELLDAWRRVKAAGAAAGPDGVSIQTFDQALERNLARLSDAVSSGGYRPGPLGRVFLKKRDGGTRIIGIPNVSDRVLHMAASQWLNQWIEPILLPQSFAYRPTMGPQRAATYCSRLAERHPWVIAADIAKYFDSVDHDILLKLLQTMRVAGRDRALLLAWLRATPLDRGASLLALKGLPQGLTIAPPLANLYLHEFDRRLVDAGWDHCRFADDFVVFAGTRSQAEERLAWMTSYLKTERRLSFKPTKTAIGPTTNGFDFVGFRIDQQCLRLPNDTPARFKVELESRLQRMGVDVDATVKSVNDLVRGWRAYYGGMSHILTRQLQGLEAWRRVRVAAALSTAGRPQLWLAKMFESLTTTDSASVAGAYGPSAISLAVAERPVVVPAQALAPQPSVPRGRTSPRRKAAVRALAIGIEQRPHVTETGDVVVPVHGAFVTKAGQTLVIKRKQQAVLEVPFDEVKHVSLVGAGISISSTLMAACFERGIQIWISDALGRGLGQLQAVRPAPRPSVVRRVLTAGQTRRGATLAKALLLGKVRNQRALLLYHSKRASRPQDIREYLRKTSAHLRAMMPDLRAIDGPVRTVRTELFLWEARAAAAYWSAWGRLVPAGLGFPGRRGRGAVDPVNSLLNYGYSRLLHLVWQAVDRAGLPVWYGVLHTGRRRSPALVLDLMEVFRVVAVDRVVIGLLGRGFFPELRPNGRLTLRTQRVFEKAWARNLARPFTGHTLAREIRTQAASFRRAVEGCARFEPVVLQW